MRPSVTRPSRSWARASASDASAARRGMCFRSVLSSRSSVSLGVASTKIGSTCEARCGSRPAFTKRRLATAGGSVHHAHGKRRVGVHLLDARLPETDRVRQSLAITRTGQQFQEEVLVLLVERAQPLGNNPQRRLRTGVGCRSRWPRCAVGVRPDRRSSADCCTEPGSTLAPAALSVGRRAAESAHVAKKACRSSSRSEALA